MSLPQTHYYSVGCFSDKRMLAFENPCFSRAPSPARVVGLTVIPASEQTINGFSLATSWLAIQSHGDAQNIYLSLSVEKATAAETKHQPSGQHVGMY